MNRMFRCRAGTRPHWRLARALKVGRPVVRTNIGFWSSSNEVGKVRKFIKCLSFPCAGNEHWIWSEMSAFIVVSSGPFRAVHVVFLPLEYIPSVPPHSTYVIVICFVLLTGEG